MPFLDPERRRQYQRDYQRAYQQRTSADRKRQRRRRLKRLLAEPWTCCIVGMLTERPCRKRPRWVDGAALYCDLHRHATSSPLVAPSKPSE